MSFGSKLHVLRTIADKFFEKPSKALYIPRLSDNFVATRKAWVAFFMHYLEDVRGDH